jgi:hypothetical protein
MGTPFCWVGLINSVRILVLLWVSNRIKVLFFVTYK